MYSLFLKEIKGFLYSLVGYIVMGVFLVLTGLFLWVFPMSDNILDKGFADINGLFNIAPIVFLLLIPAITMRSFAEEKKTGTIELLLTYPVSDMKMPEKSADITRASLNTHRHRCVLSPALPMSSVWAESMSRTRAFVSG